MSADGADLSPKELMEMEIDPDADPDANIDLYADTDMDADADADADADGDDDPEYAASGLDDVGMGMRRLSLPPQRWQGQGQDLGSGFMGLGWSVQPGEGESIGMAIFDPIQCIRQRHALQDQQEALISPQHS
jgi:hypothetical protein